MKYRKNRYPAKCAKCGKQVAEEQGTLQGPPWRTFCQRCLPFPTMTRGVELTYNGQVAEVNLRGRLGSLFSEYRTATQGLCTSRKVAGNWKTSCKLDHVPELIKRLQTAGLTVSVAPALADALKGRAEAQAADLSAAADRIEEIEAELVKRGQALYDYQRTGIPWLAARKSAILADDMGCIDGEAKVTVNRAGRGFSISLARLYEHFHGLRGRWDQAITTYIKALCDGELRQHPIVDVLDKGQRTVVLLRLESGKQLRLTPDHEVRTPDGFVRASDLRPGAKVLTNGTAVCQLCGSSDHVVTTKSAKFTGYCRKCIYRHLRKCGQGVGKWLDKDGYVRVPGHLDHPRRTTGGIYEHILVAEAMLGRFLTADEVVHHKNGKKDDNRPENLSIYPTRNAHMRYHGLRGGHLRLDGSSPRVRFIPKVDTVVTVSPAGTAHVYDVVCADPHRNFLANGIIVHNCGKTLQALLAAPADAPILVIAPAVAKGVWKREVAKWRPDLNVFVCKGRTGRNAFRWPISGEVIVVNYDILPGKIEKDDNGKAKPIATLPSKLASSCPTGCVLIADEAHAVKSSKAQRSKKFRAISELVRGRNGRAWLLTATPILNTPPELWSLLQAGGMTEAYGSWKSFCSAFDGYQGRYGMEWGAADSAGLRSPEESPASPPQEGRFERPPREALPDDQRQRFG